MRLGDLTSKRTWRGFRRCSVRIAVRYQFSRTCYKRHMRDFTSQRLLHEPFLGSTRSGTLCAATPLSKNSVRKSSPEDTRHELHELPLIFVLTVSSIRVNS